MPTAPMPKWWTKRYTAVLALLVAANVGVDFFVGRWLVSTGHVNGVGPMLGHLLSQAFLIGLWLALGGLNFVARFVTAATVVALGSFVLALGLGTYGSNLEPIVSCGTVVLGMHAVLIPLRLFGWRLDFDRAYHARSSDGLMQFRLVHLLGLITVWALPFALGRLMPRDGAILAVAAWGTAGLVGSFPAAMAIVSTRRRWLWVILAICVLPAASLMETLAFRSWFHDHTPTIVWLANLGVVATVAVNLGLLRLAGLTLFSVKEPALAETTPGSSRVEQPADLT